MLLGNDLEDKALPKTRSVEILRSPQPLFLTKISGTVSKNLVKCFKSTYLAETWSIWVRTVEFQQRNGNTFISEDNPGDKEGTGLPPAATEATSQGNNDASLIANATNDEVLPYIWCPALRPSETPIEPVQELTGSKIKSRSLVQTGLETAPRSIRQWVKGRSNLGIVKSALTQWKKKKYLLYLSVARHVVQINNTNPQSLPPDVDPEYDILYADDICIILGKKPSPEKTIDCYLWTTQSSITKSNPECDLIWQHHCHFHVTVKFDWSECT
nr:uncharacterized protein LOC129380687 [Dermacentor andersoni]